MVSIGKSFSSKLSLGILLLAVLVFTVSLGIAFTQSRHMIRAEAVGHANGVLTSTMQRVFRNIMTIETATNANLWLIERDMTPETFLEQSRRIVLFNPHIDGCSISAEPNLFPNYGRRFSVYTVREPDTITSVVEQQYEYFVKKWYKTPRDLNGPCWVVYFDDADSLELTLDGMVASYGRPLYDTEGNVAGIVSTDLSLLRLSKLMSEEKPYPNSYFMMIGEDGRYFIHPDSTRLFSQTIFSGADPVRQADVVALGHEMTSGSEGSMAVTIDGKPSLVCYQPVPGTKWSLAIVCPDSDILARYHRLTYIVVSILIVGLFVIYLFCKRAVAHAIRPLNELLSKTQDIAAGNMEVYIPQTKRTDVVGLLQNSFATMLSSLNFHLGSVRFTSEQARQRNEELEEAARLAEEADRQKTAFIQNVSHQIRTPLNIIMGFSQVLNDTVAGVLSEEEMKNVVDTMDHNAKLLNRMVLMLFDSSDSGFVEELNAHQHDIVPCNDVAREAVSYVLLHYPQLNINFKSDVPDDFCIRTSRLYLMRALREVLYNAAKYSDGQHVVFHVGRTDSTVRFVVEDRGRGIAEADCDRIFNFFTKVDDLSEGLGLGLPLAKRHAVNLGGELTLDTSYRDGARFIVELPLDNNKK